MSIERGTGWELRLGDFREVFAADERFDAIITDPPYLGACANPAPESFKHGRTMHNRRRDRVAAGSPLMRYQTASHLLLTDLSVWQDDHTDGWFLAFNDYPGERCMRDALPDGRSTPANPVVWVKPGGLVLPCGNSGSTTKAAEFVLASRRKGIKRGAPEKPGVMTCRAEYNGTADIELAGGKPLDLMRQIIRLYTEPGDLVCDPFAGGATTLLAAVIEGRRAVGSEVDPVTFARAVKRLRKGYTPDMFV